jgi:hypothetical protein
MTEYVEDAGLTAAFKAVMDNKTYHEFGMLRDTKVRIFPVMRVRTNSEGEHKASSGPPAVMKKVPDLFKATGVSADYILVVDYYAWNHPKGINAQMAQEAYLHHALMTVEVEKKQDKAGKAVIKTTNRDPDVQEFLATAERYGGYDEDQVQFSTLIIDSAQAMKQITNGSLSETPQVTAGEVQPEEQPESPEQPEPEEPQAGPTTRRRGRTNNRP